MKLSLRFRYLFVLLAVLVLDPIFTRFGFEQEDDPMIRSYYSGLLGLSLLLIWWAWAWFSPLMRRWLVVVGLALVGLMLESYANWGQWVVYPHVFGKLSVLLILFGVYAYYRRRGIPGLGFVMACLPVVVVLNMALFKPMSLTLGGFLAHERGVNVTSAYLLLLSALYFLNRYLTGSTLLHLLYFFGILALIIFLQHRTVWICTGVALTLNTLLLLRTRGTRLSLLRVSPILLIPLAVVLLGGLTIVLSNPAVMQKIEDSAEDIANADKQGTGKWRLLQYEAYEPILEEYPLAGMRFQGFELPIQFYSPDSNAPVWPDYTGHHFHSFYVDRLFYFGLLGLVLTTLPIVLLLLNHLWQARWLSPEATTLVAFISTGFLYGVSYDWPIFFYGLIGLALAAVEISAAAPVPAAAPPASLLAAPPSAHLAHASI
ncbi:O-antigen ligase family protein [Hymenobacter chitinivorans]|uniref:O-antigen ligase-like membrane protein n=1 Tax=Hymenobacter chitinivorans DSM 11115 TaxID=1121954 RepID=A0A2M9BPB3_9BACT|nr:O-antigen ligase family protein [Hymenobacter chitinivorans]PJJ59784.1 O-antigen ligase-like membrane protein [Hymenobacter chitinivorans DSM 11115]